MLLADVAAASDAVAGTPSRSGKTRLLADCLRLAQDQRDVAVVATYLAGDLRQRRTGLGYAALRDLPPPADAASLTLAEVDAAFEKLSRLSGKGSAGARRAGFASLMAQATAAEQRLLAGLVSGELRQGALHGVLVDAVAVAADVAGSDVRRAVTVAGALVPVAIAVLTDGASGLVQFRLGVGTPVRPMLAAPAPSMEAAITRVGDGEAGIEWKLDGIRVQVHRGPDGITVVTRTLDDITARVPELVEFVAALPTSSVVLDGEAIALDPAGRPLPFQRTASRTASRTDVASAREGTPLSAFFFDCLSLDGRDLIGEPGRVRWAALASIVPDSARVPRIVTDDLSEAALFFTDAVARGHEGVVVKNLDAEYQAGSRGAVWQKVKPRHTFDLVVIAAEWGHGRRQGTLSNLHLAARDPNGTFGAADGFVTLGKTSKETGHEPGWVPVGKTFKGLTDEMLDWQTETFLELETHREGHVVYVRPEQIVEIAVDGVQQSPRYPGGVALRFARVIGYREDKAPSEAATIDELRRLLK